jgi:ribosomal protein S18 acetylase RimI-like enzyme
MEFISCDYKKDLDYIYSTLKDLFGTDVENFKVTKKVLENFKEDILSCKGKKLSKVLILKDGEKYLGWIRFDISISRMTRNKMANISHFYVNSDSRGKGYGRIIFDKTKSFFEKNGVELIRLTTSENSLKFYQKLGFKVESYKMIMELK